MGDPTFWDDPEKAQKTAQDVNSLKEEVDGFHKLSAGVDDLEALQEMAAEENDESLLPEMDELLAKCRSELEHLELGMLLSGEYDANNAILTLHAGAGGTEAQDWVRFQSGTRKRQCGGGHQARYPGVQRTGAQRPRGFRLRGGDDAGGVQKYRQSPFRNQERGVEKDVYQQRRGPGAARQNRWAGGLRPHRTAGGEEAFGLRCEGGGIRSVHPKGGHQRTGSREGGAGGAVKEQRFRIRPRPPHIREQGDDRRA